MSGYDTLPGDPHQARLSPEHQQRSTARTVRLLVQAAWREGLLWGCRIDREGDLMTFRANGAALSLSGRLTEDGDRFFLDRAPDLELDAFLEIFKQLVGNLDERAWRELCDELGEAHDTQALCYALCWERPEPKEYLDFEAWTPEGHNLHPGAKTRQGFSVDDQLRYTPELAPHIDLLWIAVDKGLLSPSGEVDELFSLDENRWALPVHPWQRNNVLPHLYASEWESQALRDLDREPLRCRLCTSLRTVVPLNADIPVLKMSVGSLMTSTERSMSCHTVRQGPVYSEYLERLQEKAPLLFDGVVALQEMGGLSWSSGGDSPRARNLSLLFRQRPPVVTDGVAVPSSTLPQPNWEHTGTYFDTFFGQGEDALERFRSYVELLIPFHLELYLRFGIALEAHLQNCVVVWGPNGPRELWVRDWGGLRADAERVAEIAPDLFAQLDPASVTLTDAKKAEDKLIACLYCNHITEVVAGVAMASGVPQEDLWREVARVSSVSLKEWKKSRLAHFVLESDWPVKCLLRMRLRTSGTGDLYQERMNPLRRFF